MTAITLMDLTTYLPCDLNTKVDIASMAHALECRQPFLDHRLVELAASLPIQLKFRRGRGKRLLRDAFGDLLPKEIWNRPKMGFGVPLDHWFRDQLREMTQDLLLGPTAAGRGLFRPEVVRTMIEDHVAGTANHAYRLWCLLVLELWMRQWLDAPADSPAPRAAV